MKNLVILAAFVVLCGCSTQKTTETSAKQADSTVKTIPSSADSTTAMMEDTAVKVTAPEKTTSDNIPACIQKMIAGFTAAAVTNPPRKIFSYTYKGRTVYYVPPICCDQFSDLYDADCNLLGHPDGGYTGKGDGKFVGFAKERSNEKLVWEDKRK
jgi:hypothetical protein